MYIYAKQLIESITSFQGMITKKKKNVNRSCIHQRYSQRRYHSTEFKKHICCSRKKNIQPTIKTKYITKQIKQVNRISKHSYNFYAIDL